jgi:hypothetical protein
VIPPQAPANTLITVFSGLTLLGPQQYFLTVYAPTQGSAGGWCTTTQPTTVSATGVMEEYTYTLNGYTTFPPAGGSEDDWGAAEFSISGVPGTPPSSTVTLQSVVLSSASVAGGSIVTGTVTLSAPAPAGGVSVIIESAAPASPSTITIAGGETAGTFTVTTTPVSYSQTATIIVSLGTCVQTTFHCPVNSGAVHTAVLTINPPR